MTVSIRQINGSVSEDGIDDGQERRRRVVEFEDQDELFHIPTRFEYSEMEICDLWFQRYELQHFKRRSKELSAEIENGEALDDGECFRGIECRTREATLQRREWRWASRQAVLSEQTRQLKKQRTIDFDQIGEVYAQLTTAAQDKAHKIGLQDALLQ